MLKIKTAQFGPQPDFRNTGVRRLQGALLDTRNYATQAYDRLEQYLSDQRLDIGLAEIQADRELVTALDGALANEWQKLVTGSLV